MDATVRRVAMGCEMSRRYEIHSLGSSGALEAARAALIPVAIDIVLQYFPATAAADDNAINSMILA
jgi:hypothetical protein